MSEVVETGSELLQKMSDCQEYPRWIELIALIDLDPLGIDMIEYSRVFTAVMEYKKKALKSLVKEEPEIYWITVNPKPEAELEIILKCLQNFCSRKAVRDYHYSIEQRGETEQELGKGIHSHLLVKWDRKQNKYVKQFLIESVKRIVGNHNNNILNIRRITSNIYQDKLDYLNGLKWDKDKDLKIKFDKVFREKNNILCIYKKNADE